MPELWSTLRGTNFMPHGHCFLWQPDVLWLNVGSDALIALAYFAIPTSLHRFVRQRLDLTPQFKLILAMFGAFIVACGTTHVMAVWTVWHPVYALDGLVKAATAIISLATAVLLMRLLPQALALPSPAALERANSVLALEIEQRKDAETHFRTLLESAPDAMVICDAGGRITFANDQIETLFDIPRDELIGQSIDMLVPQSVRGAHAAHRAAYLHEPQTRLMGEGIDLRGRRRDGTEFPVEISLSPLRTMRGILVTAAIRDITARRQGEEALHDSARREVLSRQLLAAQETERRRIAVELHDQIGQSLTALKLCLQMSRSDPAGSTTTLDESLTIVEQLLQEVREIALDLRPSILDDLGLASALRWYVDRQARRVGWTVSIETSTLDRRVPADIEVACFRVAQEALTNISRHADAHHVHVAVCRRLDGVELVVRDDGRGMNTTEIHPAALRGSSLGMLGMEERVTLLGGRFEIESGIGQGTEVRAYFPLHPVESVTV